MRSSRYHYGTWKGLLVYLLPAATVACLMTNTRSFNEILSLAEVQGKMPFLKRYLRREETAREISHCHADLDQALTLFSVCIPTVLSTIILIVKSDFSSNPNAQTCPRSRLQLLRMLPRTSLRTQPQPVVGRRRHSLWFNNYYARTPALFISFIFGNPNILRNNLLLADYVIDPLGPPRASNAAEPEG